MTKECIGQKLSLVEAETDLNRKAMLTAGLVSELFRVRGFEPVVVGGSAIEFHTDGAYMSGDTDLCWAGSRAPTPDEQGEIMSQLPNAKRKGTRSWEVGGIWVDLLTDLTTYGNGTFSRLETPTGDVILLSVEELLAERVFAARRWTGYNASDDDCAKKLIACILTNQVACDWEETRRIAGLPAYRCLAELEAMRAEVEAQLSKTQP
jgi:hypothetical protein